MSCEGIHAEASPIAVINKRPSCRPCSERVSPSSRTAACGLVQCGHPFRALRGPQQVEDFRLG